MAGATDAPRARAARVVAHRRDRWHVARRAACALPRGVAGRVPAGRRARHVAGRANRGAESTCSRSTTRCSRPSSTKKAAQFVDAMLASPAYVVVVSEQIGWDVVPVAASGAALSGRDGPDGAAPRQERAARVPRRRRIRARPARRGRTDRRRILNRRDGASVGARHVSGRRRRARRCSRSDCAFLIRLRSRSAAIVLAFTRHLPRPHVEPDTDHVARRAAAAVQRGLVDGLGRAAAQRAADRAPRRRTGDRARWLVVAVVVHATLPGFHVAAGVHARRDRFAAGRRRGRSDLRTARHTHAASPRSSAASAW